MERKVGRRAEQVLLAPYPPIRSHTLSALKGGDQSRLALTDPAARRRGQAPFLFSPVRISLRQGKSHGAWQSPSQPVPVLGDTTLAVRWRRGPDPCPAWPFLQCPAQCQGPCVFLVSSPHPIRWS